MPAGCCQHDVDRHGTLQPTPTAAHLMHIARQQPEAAQSKQVLHSGKLVLSLLSKT